MSNSMTASASLPGNPRWGWLLTGGIFLLLAGMLLLVYPTSGSMAVTLFTGWMLMIGGVVAFITAIADRDAGGMWLGMIIGAIMAVAGGLLAFNPLAGTVTLTMVVTIWLLVDGTIGSIGSLVTRGPAWGWRFASGLLSLALGIMLLNSFPSASLWLLGVFAGISLLFRGTALIAISFAVRSYSR